MSCWLSWVPASQWLHFCVYISSNRFSFYCLLVPKYRSDDTIVYPIRMKKVTFKLKESTWNGWRKSWEFFFSSFLRLLQFTYDCGHYDIRDGSMSYGRFFFGFWDFNAPACIPPKEIQSRKSAFEIPLSKLRYRRLLCYILSFHDFKKREHFSRLTMDMNSDEVFIAACNDSNWTSIIRMDFVAAFLCSLT